VAAPRDGFAMLVGSRGFPSYPAGFAKWPANNLQLSCVRREQQFCGAGLRVRIRTRPACNLYLSLTEHGPARTRLGRRTRRPRSARNAGRGWSLELQPLRLVIPSGHSAHASPSPGLSLPVGEGRGPVPVRGASHGLAAVRAVVARVPVPAQLLASSSFCPARVCHHRAFITGAELPIRIIRGQAAVAPSW